MPDIEKTTPFMPAAEVAHVAKAARERHADTVEGAANKLQASVIERITGAANQGDTRCTFDVRMTRGGPYPREVATLLAKRLRLKGYTATVRSAPQNAPRVTLAIVWGCPGVGAKPTEVARG